MDGRLLRTAPSTTGGGCPATPPPSPPGSTGSSTTATSSSADRRAGAHGSPACRRPGQRAKPKPSGLAIGRSSWLLRPGDLVPVRFLLHTTPRGLYVPVDVITIIDDKHVLYVVEKNTARAMEVTVHETYRELRRIEGAQIGPGTQVIVGGMHYVSDGQPVTIVGEERLPL